MACNRASRRVSQRTRDDGWRDVHLPHDPVMSQYPGLLSTSSTLSTSCGRPSRSSSGRVLMESQQQLVANAEGERQHLASRSPNLQSDDRQLVYPSSPPVSTHLLCEVGSLTARRAPAAAGQRERLRGFRGYKQKITLVQLGRLVASCCS